MIRKACHTGRDGQWTQGSATEVNVEGPNSGAQFFRSLSGQLQTCTWQNKCEFLTSIATGNISTPYMPLQESAQGLENDVACLMTMSVVKALEMIEVYHQDTEGRVVALRTLDLQREGFFQIAPVEQAGQRITNGLL